MRNNTTRKTAFTSRMESDLSCAILQLLQRAPMEDLTVSDLCAFSNYPRSTFYKYYYDLEDLFTDYLLQVWHSVGFKSQDDFFHMARRLFQYQRGHSECAAVLSMNRNSLLFRSCFQKVLRHGLLQAPFMSVALRNSAFPSEQFIADYLIRSIDLLKTYEEVLDQNELRLTSVHLLYQPFAERAR